MPTYEFRCPKGHEFERFYKTMSAALMELPCPECGAMSARQMSGGAGLLFKGSGFYLTDYGKNAHRGDGKGKAGEGGKAEGGKAEGGKAEGGKAEGGRAESGKSESPSSKPAPAAKSEAPAPKSDSSKSDSASKTSSSKPKKE
jgi:putative FmdB family regulatory protein